MHHGGPLRKVSTETHAVRVCDAHTGWNDVVEHSRKLVEAVYTDGATGFCERSSKSIDFAGKNRPFGGPGDVRQHTKDPVEADLVGCDLTSTEEM